MYLYSICKNLNFWQGCQLFDHKSVSKVGNHAFFWKVLVKNWCLYQGLNFIFYKIFCIFTFKFFCTLGCFKIFNFQNFTLKQVRARKFDFTPLICNVERYFMRSFIKIEIGVKKVISQCKFNHKNFWNTLTLTFFKKKFFMWFFISEW